MKKIGILTTAMALILAIAGCTKERNVNTDGNLVPRTVEQDASLPSINIMPLNHAATTLHAEAFGNPADPMILVIHGGPGGDYRSLMNCKQFASQGYYVVFYDQRGSGLSKRHRKEDYSIELMEADLGAVIRHYRTSPSQKIFLLGHSWGAILASSFINHSEGTIHGLILAEPGGLLWDDIKGYVERTRDIRFTSELMNDATYLDQFITGKQENDHALLDYKLGLLASSDGSTDNPIGNEGIVPFWRQGFVVNKALFDLGEKQKPDFTTNLQHYTSKVLFAYSENNKAYGAAYAQKVASAFPNVELFQVKDAGHDMLSFPAGWQNFYPTALAYFNSLR